MFIKNPPSTAASCGALWIIKKKDPYSSEAQHNTTIDLISKSGSISQHTTKLYDDFVLWSVDPTGELSELAVLWNEKSLTWTVPLITDNPNQLQRVDKITGIPLKFNVIQCKTNTNYSFKKNIELIQQGKYHWRFPSMVLFLLLGIGLARYLVIVF